MEKGLFGPIPCETCNGAGWLNKNYQPPSEWEVIMGLLLENREQKKKIYLLTSNNDATNEQHDGVGKNNYRGD